MKSEVTQHLNAVSIVTSSLLDITELDRALHAGGRPLVLLRRALKQCAITLQQRFQKGAPVEQLVHERAQLVDVVVIRAFDLYLADAKTKLALTAVGGYGRGELHPCSDIDLLILVTEDRKQQYRAAIEQFLAFLWDIGLEANHSVRTPEDCVTESRADVTIATNLMESRLLTGASELFTRMRRMTGPSQLWPTAEFFIAKRREQQQRHEKYHNTAYRLEPNIKESPGGLRDIQMISWVAKRHFDAGNLHDLVRLGFLTEHECATLIQGQAFLWRVRFALHILDGRREDRLLFDSQLRLARQFGYQDAEHGLAVEQFMQDYYRTIKQLSLLNDMLLQLLEEAILTPAAAATPINMDFEERSGFLYARNPALFERRPAALLELFHVLQQHPELKGVGAVTLREMRRNLHRLDEGFRANPGNRKVFMDILREPRRVTHELRRMNRYGVLGRYLPAFGAIVGRMQYDLFHAYTVDEHILFVVGNLRRFALARYDQEFPLCSRIMQALPKPEIAYLAALFHDIAKGRGGDHSQLGAQEAENFCIDHGLSRYDARLVAWLVQHHLLLSLTAQKKDISDPKVVHDFAVQIGDQLHLDYLYTLTVADVRGTNPDLWNSWKARLFDELYRTTGQALRRGLENPIDKDELVLETRDGAAKLLRERGLTDAIIERVWINLSEEYFLRHSVDEIAWHTSVLADTMSENLPMVLVREQAQPGGSMVCVYSHHDDFIFGRVTAMLSQLGLTVQDARLVPVGSDTRLDTYVVLEDNGAPISNAERLAEIQQMLRREIRRRNASPISVTRRAPRQVRMFTTPTQVQFAEDVANHRTVIEITAGDRPGLLSLIGQALSACELRLQNAKITTVGERAEDVFFITDARNLPLKDIASQEKLRAALLARIGEAS